MAKDNGGWRSVGSLPQRIRCKACGNDDATLLETVIYGKHWRTVYCNVCSATQEPDDTRAEQ